MFIDETAISTHMIRRHGHGLSGDRVVDHETLGSWNTHALIAAIRPTGWSAAMVLKGVADADAFATDLEECVVPTLKPDEIVVLDNVSSRHDGRIRPLIQSTGAKLYDLPPHSPDWAPIENAFSVWKAGLNRLGAKTFAEPVRTVGQLLDSTPAEDGRNCFAHCGYA